ncbi:MAG TPA: hypothetical protein VHO70_15270 [Chitinispirillaceae bacterium]|nr:hypothetical protein [Chitinispirillaceae bacterium]
MKQKNKPNVTFIMAAMLAIYVQTIHGQWLPTGGPKRGAYVADLCVSGSYIFACDGENGVFRSTDNGASWIAVNAGLTNKYIQHLAVMGNDIYAGVNNSRIDVEGFLFLSSDSGATWKSISSGFPKLQYMLTIHSIEVCGNSVFVVTTNGNGIFRSIDNGITWSAGDSGLVYPIDTLIYNSKRYEISSIAMNGDTVLAASGHDIYVSYDSASSWTAIKTEEIACSSFTSLALAGNNLFVGTYEGLYKSANCGKNWSAGNFELANIQISKLASKDDTIFATDQPGGGLGLPQLYRSADNGKNWTVLNKFNGWISSLYVRGDDVFVCCYDTLYRSTDNGTTWSTIGAGIHVTSIATIGNTIQAGTQNDGLYRTTDNGNTWWSSANTGLPDSGILSLAVTGNRIFAGTTAGLFRSIDNGISWTAVNSGNLEIYAKYLAVDGNTIVAADYNSVHISIDNGQNWITVTDTTLRDILSLAIKGEVIFVGTYSGVFQITNNGNGWDVANTRLVPSEKLPWVSSLAVNETHVFAATKTSSVWSRPLSDFPVANKTLKRNIPGQSNFKIVSSGNNRSYATITFSLPYREHVVISVYNLSGSIIKSIANSYFESGSHQISWNTRSLSPGSYLVKMKTPANTGVQVFTQIQ